MSVEVISRSKFAGRGLVRLIWLALGALSLAFGAVGVVLPILPTTPFVILAAFAFAKSSPLMSTRLRHSRIFGPIIADWQTNGTIAPRYKGLALTMMAGALGLAIAMEFSPMVLIIQATCMATAAIFILSRPSRST